MFEEYTFAKTKAGDTYHLTRPGVRMTLCSKPVRWPVERKDVPDTLHICKVCIHTTGGEREARWREIGR